MEPPPRTRILISACKSLAYSRYRLLYELFASDGSDRAEKVAAFNSCISHDNYFVEEGSVFSHLDINDRASANGNRLVSHADKREHQVCRSFRKNDFIISVKACNDSDSRSLDKDACTHKRFTVFVSDYSGNLILCRKSYRHPKRKQHKKDFLSESFHGNWLLI